MPAVQPAAPPPTPLSVDTPVAGGARPRYRRTVSLSVPLGAGAGGGPGAVLVQPGGATLEGQFTHLDLDVRSGGVDLRGQVSDASPGVAVRMDGRWAVRQVTVTAGVLGPLALHRMDGAAVAADATASATLSGDGGATFVLSGDAQFFDVRFAVVSPSADLAPAQVSAIGARSYPTGARIGLASPDLLDEAEIFWQSPGESLSALSASAGAPLGAALQRHLDARLEAAAQPGAPALADPLPVTLVLESDQPCRFQFAAGGLAASVSPVVRAFADAGGGGGGAGGGGGGGGSGKRVLRFSARDGFRHELAVSLPADAVVTRASLRLLPSLRHAVASAEAAASLGAAPASRAGMHVGTELWVATQLSEPAGATTGLAIPIVGLLAGTRLRWELHTDAQGQPSGQVLDGGAVEAPRPGLPAWIAWSLAAPIPAGRCWLAVVAEQGAAVWLGAPGGADALVLKRRPAPGPFTPHARAAGRGLLVQALAASATPTAGAAPPLTIGVGTAAPAALDLPAPDSSAGSAGGAIEVDLTASVQALIAAAAGPGPVLVPLTLAAAVPGVVTVYPPEIVLA